MSTGTEASKHRGTEPEAPCDQTLRGASRRGGFSLIEMLIALTISATLLTATMVALDVMFKRYSAISDSASTHVIARVVMHRILSMIRTGTQFGPYPADVLDPAQNPADYDNIEFVSLQDSSTGTTQITRIEKRAGGTGAAGTDAITLRGPFVLWLVVETTVNGATTTAEHPLIDGLMDIKFHLTYGPGPTLQSATVDMTISPRGSEYATFDSSSGQWAVMKFDDASGTWKQQKSMSVDGQAPTIRLVASTSPRSGVN